jgi:hypothetical protein
VTTPIDFEVIDAEQNRCPETQRVLGSSSLTNQVLSSWLGTSPQAIFTQWCRKIFENTFFSTCSTFTPWEARLPASYLF